MIWKNFWYQLIIDFYFLLCLKHILSIVCSLQFVMCQNMRYLGKYSALVVCSINECQVWLITSVEVFFTVTGFFLYLITEGRRLNFPDKTVICFVFPSSSVCFCAMIPTLYIIYILIWNCLISQNCLLFGDLACWILQCPFFALDSILYLSLFYICYWIIILSQVCLVLAIKCAVSMLSKLTDVFLPMLLYPLRHNIMMF